MAAKNNLIKKGILTDDELQPQLVFEGKETELEEAVIGNMALIQPNTNWPAVVKIERQFALYSGKNKVIIDLLLTHSDGSKTIIECKTGKTNRNDNLSAIGQLLFYNTLFELTFGKKARMVIACPRIVKELKIMIDNFKLDISLLMIDGSRGIFIDCSIN